ncbi:uncharacterized protein [Ptychodera flava]|uniref:uncharacterized protein n=1 Tax=Ptychodera flava TaxID=63121 RepID=UPI003969E20D
MESFGKEQSSKPEPIELKHYTAKDDSPPPSYNGVQDADEEKNDLQESDNASGETEGETNEAFSHDEITSENAPTSDDVERGSISKDVEEEEKSVTDAKLDEGYFDGPWGKCAIATVMLATFFVISFGVGYGVAEIILKVEVKSCGTQTVLPNFDSNAVEPGNWPWHVALYKRDGSGNDYLCSGALVMENWVATSASCVHGIAKEDITVWAGKQSLSSAGDMDTGHVIKSIYPYWTFDGNDDRTTTK